MVYYPFMAAVLYLRLEEYAEKLNDAIVTSNDEDSPQLVLPSGFILSPSNWEPQGKEDEIEVNGVKTKTLWISTIPRLARWGRNEAMEADTLDLYFDIVDLPIDPRIIRSLGVAFYAGLYKPEDFEAMVKGKGFPQYVYDSKNLRFSGFADEITQDAEELHIKCRDMTGILIDTPVPTVAYNSIKWEGNIEDVIVSVIRTLPAFNKIPIVLRDFSKGQYQFQPAIRSKIPVRKKKVAGSSPDTSKKRKATRPPKIKAEKYWDLLTDIAVQSGFCIYCDVKPSDVDENTPLTRIVVAPADSLFNEYNTDGGKNLDETIMTDAVSGKSWKEPSGRSISKEVDIGNGQKYRPEGMLFVWGNNLSVCNYTRNLSDQEVSTVELVCQDGNKIIRARFPDKNTPPWTIHPTAIWAQDRAPKVFAVSGIVGAAGANGEISIEKALKRAAEQTFYALSKGEMELHLETAELTSSGGAEGVPDVYNLKAGFPVEVLHAAGKAENNFDPRVDLAGMTTNDFTNYLKSKGLNEKAAKAIAGAMRGEQGQNLLTKVWFTRKVEFTISFDSVMVAIDAVNYVTPRIEAYIKDSK